MRTDGGAKVSFLFFIDIMMCISGVMLFVIMLLILDLSNGTGLSAGAEKEAKAAIPEIHKQIDALQPKLDALRQHSGEAADLPVLPAMTPQDAEKKSAELEKKLNEKQRSLQDVEKEIVDLQEKKDNLPGNFRVVTFQISDDDSRRALVMIECAATQYTVQAPGAKPQIFQDMTLEDRLAKVLEALSSFDKEKIAILVATETVGIQKRARVCRSVVAQKAGYQTGIEPLDETHTTIKARK